MKKPTSHNFLVKYATPLLIAALATWASFATIQLALVKTAPAVIVQKVEPKEPEMKDVTIVPTLTYVNKIRTDRGLRPLTEDARLDGSAKQKADDMLARDYFDHDDPNGMPWFRFLYAAAPGLHHTGENIGRCYHSNQAVYDAWVKSPEHYANLIDPGFTIYGSSIEWDNDAHCMVWVDHFGGY